MDDRIFLPMNSKRHAQRVLRALDRKGLHDPQVNVIPQIVRQGGEIGLQISRWDTKILAAWRDYCDNYIQDIMPGC